MEKKYSSKHVFGLEQTQRAEENPSCVTPAGVLVRDAPKVLWFGRVPKGGKLFFFFPSLNINAHSIPVG